MAVRDELVGRLHEELGDIDKWLQRYEDGLITGHKHRSDVWKDTTAMDKEAYERLKKNISDAIRHIEKYGQ